MTESRDSGRRAREIFRSLTELPQSHRPARLREACHGNADLEGAVRELLGRFEGEDAAFLEPSHRLEALGEIPHRIGSYRILSLLGEGGTGIVFRAERDWPKHEVALKLIPPRPFLHRREVLQRFAHEAELLARLRHPSITQLYEAGATETELGPQPFLSMELVEGRPITDYVTEHESSLEERLRLLLRVCRAVEHAHERGVVHRDLKPSNILVDAAGHPKVVDFGIAKLLAEEPRSDGPNTRDGELLGTPAYMSPEQARGKGNIDGRADVYALGVLGYELLSGRLPRRIELGRTESYHEEPTRLGRIDRRWRGDIETVFRKALEPDLGERYATVGEMADDLERYLNHEPIQARRASTWYQLRKFARRNRTLVSGAAAVSVTLAAGLIATFVLLGMTREEAGRTERVLTYFDEVIASMGPDGAGKDQRISSLILGELETLEERFGDEPLLLARVSDTFGRALLGQGFLVEAEPLLRRAVDIRNEQLGSTSPEALDSRLSLAELTYQRGRYLAALEEARSIRTLTEVVPEQHEERGAKAGVLEGRILLEIGQFEKAEALLDELLASQVKAELRPALEELHVQSLLEQDRLEDARRVALEGVKSARDLFGEEHPMTLRARQAAARVLMQSKNPEEAGEELEEVLRLTQARHSDHHSFLADVLTNLGRVAHLSGDLEEAQELYREAEQIQIGLVATSWHPEQIERLLLSQRAERESTGEDAADLASSLKDVESTSGADSPQALAIRIRLALAYRSQGKLVEAATEQARVVETFERQFGRGHPKTVGSKILYYEIRRQAADPTIGPDLRELIEQLASTFGPDYRLTQLVRNNLGLYLTTSQDDWDEAESLFRSVIAARIRSYGEGIYDEIRASAEGNLGSLLARRAALRKKRALLAGESMSDEEKSRVQSDLNEAVPLLRAQIEALEGIGTLTGADIINAKNSLVVGLGLRKAEGDLEEAVALSEDVVRRYTEDVGPDDFFTSHARYNRARLLTSQERFEEALAELNALYSAARQSPDMRLRFWAPAFRSARAECFFHLENFVVAERELKAALPGLRAIGPDFVQNAEMLLAKIAEKWNDDATSEETPVSEKESTEGKEGGK